MNLAMYILVNGDIKFGKGVLAGQVGHAVGIFHYRGKYTKELMDDYMKKPRKVILKCPQSKLEELEREGYITIRENDTPQLPKNALTCINIGIYDRDNNEVPDLVKGLKLYPK
jgi:Uncharacterized conserved protein